MATLNDYLVAARVTPEGAQAILKSKELRDELLALPEAARHRYVHAMEEGDPEGFGALANQLRRAFSRAGRLFGGPRKAYALAAEYGISESEVDALYEALS